ncbi:MAG: hypothetical protein B7Z29_19800 [Hyphomicrobium sp. 12-62-95]|nr:MAG: hypothetical protein B7Z29_19800 [Hyphomicrobium sp. 12-62-95]
MSGSTSFCRRAESVAESLRPKIEAFIQCEDSRILLTQTVEVTLYLEPEYIMHAKRRIRRGPSLFLLNLASF